MRFALCFFFAFAYMVIGLMGMFPHGFVVSYRIQDYADAHIGMILLLLLLVSVFFSFLVWQAQKDFYWLARKDITQFRSKRISETAGFGVMFFVFSFVYSQGQLSFYNRSGTLAQTVVRGTITYERIQYGRRGQRTYFITVTDSANHDTQFTVSDYVYNRYKKGDTINKVFSTGRLGVLYRKEEE